MRKLLLGLLLIASPLIVASASAQTTSEWMWHKACTADAAITQCDVWFNSLEPADALTLRMDDEAQEITLRTYTELETPSINAVLLHLPGLGRDERSAVKNGLSAFVKSSKSFQNIGIFASGADDFQVVGFPGELDEDLLHAISRWRSDDTAKDPAGDLAQVFEILGGNPAERKVVYWITSGLQLTDAQTSAIVSAASDQGVRIVILHLVRSELDINATPALRQLGEQARGFYAFKVSDYWQSSLGALGIYSTNGARVTFEGADLCGSVPATFTASLGGDVIEISETISFSPCATSPRVEPTPEPELESPDLEATPEEDATEAGSPDEDPSTEEQAEDTPGTGTEEDAGEEGEIAPAEDDPAEPVPTQRGVNIMQLVLLTGVGSLVVVVVILLLVRGKKKADPAGSMDVRGYLEFESAGEYQRFPIDRDTTAIGRGEDNDVVLRDDTVSASHAVVKVERSGQILLVDLKSSNGSFVNDEEITQQKLSPGDHLKFGNYHVVYAGK